jgi:predicted RNA binding protein YcfA (HicA-like mRNA interferase family)
VPKIAGVNHLDAVRALQKAGFRIIRQGKHIIMSDGAAIVTIPRHAPSTRSRWGRSPRRRA